MSQCSIALWYDIVYNRFMERIENNMNTLNIASNIVELRKMKGVTQEEMASFIGVTKASVSKWENGVSQS